MKKKTITLKESQLKRMITESVRKMINEFGYSSINKEFVGQNLDDVIETLQDDGYGYSPRNEKRSEDGKYLYVYMPGYHRESHSWTKDYVQITALADDKTRSFIVQEVYYSNEGRPSMVEPPAPRERRMKYKYDMCYSFHDGIAEVKRVVNGKNQYNLMNRNGDLLRHT